MLDQDVDMGPGLSHETRAQDILYTKSMKQMKQYWLMKSEPSEYSIDDLARDGQALDQCFLILIGGHAALTRRLRPKFS